MVTNSKLQISQRGIEMPESPIRKLAPLAYKAEDKGVKIYRLNIGQPDLPTPQKALDILKNIDRTTLEYSPSQGYGSLRQALVGYYERYQIKLNADEIIITSGGSEAVLFAFMSCLNPGDEIERTKAILICNPNNPTGYLYTQREMNQIRDLVKKYNLYLFSDEVYREFIYTGSPYISAMHLEGIEQNVVLIDSVSKRYSECGIRIGALITKNERVRKTVMKFCQARLSPPLIGQLVAEASIEGTEQYSRDVYDEYVERRKCLIDGVNRIPGCYTPVPMGAFYTVAKLPVDNAEDFCAWCLTDFVYKDAETPEGCTGETVMMAPAAGFYSNPDLGKDQVRLAYVLKKKDLQRALHILSVALVKYREEKC